MKFKSSFNPQTSFTAERKKSSSKAIWVVDFAVKSAFTWEFHHMCVNVVRISSQNILVHWFCPENQVVIFVRQVISCLRCTVQIQTPQVTKKYQLSLLPKKGNFLLFQQFSLRRNLTKCNWNLVQKTCRFCSCKQSKNIRLCFLFFYEVWWFPFFSTKQNLTPQWHKKTKASDCNKGEMKVFISKTYFNQESLIFPHDVVFFNILCEIIHLPHTKEMFVIFCAKSSISPIFGAKSSFWI